MKTAKPKTRKAWYDPVLLMLVRLLSRLPLTALYAIADLMHFILYDVARFQRSLLLVNLRRAFPEIPESTLQQLARDTYRQTLHTLFEAIRALRMGKVELLRRVIIRNPEVVMDVINSGKSVVAATAHQGNWEWLLLALGAGLDCRFDAMYKRLSHPAFDRLMLKLRSQYDIRMYAQDEMRALLRDRDQPRLIGMVADHGPQPSEDKHWADFLGIETAFYKGPEQITRLLDCPFYFAHMQRTRRGHYEMHFELLAESPGELKQGELMDRYVAAVEQQIRDAPPDWMWIYKRWKYTRETPASVPAA